MATLAQATQSTRTILKWAGIAILVFILLRFILFPIGKLIFNAFFPNKPPAPTVAFGKLPQIPFPAKVRPPDLTFEIKTTTGTLPTTCIVKTCQPSEIPDRLNVYRISKNEARFSSLDRAKEKVSRIGFTEEAVALSPVLYQWLDPKVENRKIIFNTVTDRFDLTTPIASEESETNAIPPSASDAINVAKNFLSSMSLLPSDLDDSKTKTIFLALKNNVLIKATSRSESNFVRVGFYRKPISNLPIVNPNPEKSLILILIKTGRNLGDVAETHYSYVKVEADNSSTYPIKTAQEAFDELVQGGGFIARRSSLQSAIGIRNVYLAYYEGAEDMNFLLPVFVFEGDNDFIAFISAVKNEWVE